MDDPCTLKKRAGFGSGLDESLNSATKDVSARLDAAWTELTRLDRELETITVNLAVNEAALKIIDRAVAVLHVDLMRREPDRGQFGAWPISKQVREKFAKREIPDDDDIAILQYTYLLKLNRSDELQSIKDDLNAQYQRAADRRDVVRTEIVTLERQQADYFLPPQPIVKSSEISSPGGLEL